MHLSEPADINPFTETLQGGLFACLPGRHGVKTRGRCGGDRRLPLEKLELLLGSERGARIASGQPDSVCFMVESTWAPESEHELRSVVEAGMLTETHHLDIKREIGVKPGDRAELARDLAQFAIDGGALIVGVEEDKATRTWTLTPQKLVGLQERIEQIANSQIDPPLSIAIRVLALAEDPTQGYVVIQVPVSPRAPHMVGGIYYGRGGYNCEN